MPHDASEQPPARRVLVPEALSPSATGTTLESLDVRQVRRLELDSTANNRVEVPSVEMLAIDAAIQRHLQRQALLEALPLDRSFDPETTAAWLDTVATDDDSEGRYEYKSPDGAAAAELGRGAVGRVLLARDKQLGRDVAIKELLPEVAASPAARSAELRFVREARISGQLEHPNIVTVHDLGRRKNGQLYYTMKVVRGRTLASAIAQAGTLPKRLALLGHYYGLCQAIAYAHSQGVIHRDIKPENVMIGEFGETVVLDWGGARVTEADALLGSIPPQADHGHFIGTPLYMSPEQTAGQASQIDERSDVWALGVVLYQLLTGTPPFEANSFSELRAKICESSPRHVAELEPRVAPELIQIAERALQKSRAERYADARQLVRDLEAYLAKDPADDRTPQAPEPPRGKRAVNWLLVFIALALGAWLGHVWL